MRRLFVVIALLGIMLVMRSFQTRIDAPGNVITLAAIGFVVLTAFAVADMGTRLSLPRVTGFILAGVALGPSAANILSTEVVTEMRMFNTLALGLIATSAGLELDLKSLVPLLKTLGATTAIKVLLGVPVVGLTLFAMAHFTDLGVDTFNTRAGLALVMGVLAIGTSPSIALAILTETKAKGRLSDLVLGAAVFKDLVVVISLAIGVAITGTLLNPSAVVDSSVLVHVGIELGGSILAGAALGGILIAYIRFIQAEMLLFVAAMILVVAELCRTFHLELLLVFIAAGFVVRNFSEHEHDLMHPLELVALPVFVVFFTIAGASIQLTTTWSILPAAVAVCAARAGVYWIAAWAGGRWGREPPAVRTNAWAAYLPQAGVTLGLVGLAAQKLPSLGEQITNTGMAVVAINLLVGPIALRVALSRAGEIPGTKPTATETPSPLSTRQPAARDRESVPPSVKAELATLPDELARFVDEVRATTLTTLLELITSQHPKSVSLELGDEPSVEVRLSVVRAYRTAAKAWYERWIKKLDALPIRTTASQSLESLQARPDDSRLRRLRLWWLRVQWAVSRLARVREVPVRLCARMTVEPTVAKLATHFYESSLERHFAASTTSARAGAAIPELWEQAVERALVDFSRLLETANSPRMHAKGLRFSEVEQIIRTELSPLDEGRDEFYAARASAIWGSEVAKHQLVTLGDVVSTALSEHLSAPARELVARLEPAFDQLTNQLLEWIDVEGAPSPEVSSVTRWRDRLTETRQRNFDEFARALRASVVMRELGTTFRLGLEKLPTDLRCYQVPAEGDARHGVVRRIDLYEIAEKHLIKRLLPALDQSVRGLSNTFANLPRKIRDILEPALVQIEALADDKRGGGASRIQERTRATISRLQGLKQRVAEQINTELNQQQGALIAALNALEKDVVTAQLMGETTTHRLRQWMSRLNRRVQPWLALYSDKEDNKAAEDDARKTRLVVEKWRRPSVPEIAARWLSQQPVRDERIYSVQPGVLDRMLEEETRWREGQRASILVRGELGSGKTSLLNMCELEFRSPRVIRLDAEGPEQSRTLREALSNVLGSGTTETAITYALVLQRPVLLVDNLFVWMSRSADSVEELRRLLSLITRTTEALWVMTIDPLLLERLSKFVAVQAAFTTVVDIPAVTRRDLEAMVFSRATRANQKVEFKPTLLGRMSRRLGFPGDEILYFALLNRAGRGNPGRALALALRSASGTDGTLRFEVHQLRNDVPRLGDQLSASQLATLMTILQHGPMDLKGIAFQVGLNQVAMELDLAFLLSSGLLQADNRSYDIAHGVRWIVADELERVGAMGTHQRRAQKKLHRRKRLLKSLVSAAALFFSLYVFASWTKDTVWPHWAVPLGVLLVLLLPVVQNSTSGVLLRLFTDVRLGDTIRVGSTHGTIRRFGVTHLQVVTAKDEAVLIPHRALFLEKLTLQRGTWRGAQVYTRIPQSKMFSADSETLLRLAYLCPYRVPHSPVSVRSSTNVTIVNLHAWHGQSAKPVEGFLISRLEAASKTSETVAAKP